MSFQLHKRISDVFTRSSHVVNPVLCFKKTTTSWQLMLCSTLRVYHLLARDFFLHSTSIFYLKVGNQCGYIQMYNGSVEVTP